MEPMQFELPIVVAALVYILSARYYAIAPQNEAAAIAQTSIAEFDPNLIRKHRVPYIIDERLPGIDDLKRSVFKYEYIMEKKIPLDKPTTFRSGGMFTLVYATQDGQELALSHPAGKDVQTLRLSKGRLVIMPPRWLAKALTLDLHILKLFDPASAIATFGGLLVW